jgi:hypothetical protein
MALFKDLETLIVGSSQNFLKRPGRSAAAELVDMPNEALNKALTSGPHQDADNWFIYFFLG